MTRASGCLRLFFQEAPPPAPCLHIRAPLTLRSAELCRRLAKGLFLCSWWCNTFSSLQPGGHSHLSVGREIIVRTDLRTSPEKMFTLLREEQRGRRAFCFPAAPAVIYNSRRLMGRSDFLGKLHLQKSMKQISSGWFYRCSSELTGRRGDG